MIDMLDAGQKRCGEDAHRPGRSPIHGGRRECRAYPCQLLRWSFSDEQGTPRKETLANLSALPPEGDQCASQGFEGATIVDADVAFETGLSVPHEVLRWRM
jgi:hypothetical protein